MVERALAEVAERSRTRALIGRRATVKKAEHRYLLALVLNVRGRANILRLIGKAFPQAPAAETLLRWVRELCGVEAGEGGGGLGLRFDAAALQVLQSLIQGCRGEALLASLKMQHGNDAIAPQERRIAELERRLSSSSVFGPLLWD